MISGDARELAEKFAAELQEQNAAVFIGAGFSKAAGFVDWAGLLAPVAKQLGLDVGKESDLVAVAQFHLNNNGSQRHQLNQLLVENFTDLPEPTLNHKILARLPIETYWTTNYDRMIERALEACGKKVDAKYTHEHLATTRRGRDAVVFKMHGDIEHPHSAVLTRDDYEKYHRSHAPFITALSGDLVEKTFLFLGLSFTDPNLDYVLARIRSNFTQGQRQHYYVTKKRTKLAGETTEDGEYAARKQGYMARDLQRFNIKTVFVDDYAHITEILKAIESRFRSRTVFISGSAVDYTPWGEGETLGFSSTFARWLVSNGYRVASGCGIGIGGAVVTGAIQEIYSARQRSITDNLLVRPFPIGIADPVQREATYETYRRELVAQAGIAVFISGNKEDAGKTVEAGGVFKEFDVAVDAGLHVVPVGASGWAAKELWTRVTGDLNRYYPKLASPVGPLLNELGDASRPASELLDSLTKLIQLLSKE